MSTGNDRSKVVDVSTGNDIVALAATDEDRTSRPRFYSRILTPDELSLYDELTGGGLSFSSFVWLMWSIKESAYKYVNRADPGLRFAPLKIPVTRLRPRDDRRDDRRNEGRDDFYEGVIRSQRRTLYSRSFLADETIMTVVSAQEGFSNVHWGLRRIENPNYSNQSALVRTFALQSLSIVLPGAELRIIKSPDGPPELWDGEHRLHMPLSLAHHGPYVAWSYQLPCDRS
jgi:hypothetical protein